MKTFSFIVPMRGREEMKSHFEKNLAKNFSNYEIIYIYQDNDLPISIAQLRNIGSSFADGEYLVQRDVDVIDLHPIDLIAIYNNLGGPYRAYNRRQHITIDENENYINKGNAHDVPGHGGYIIYKKEDWIKKNGFTNLCIGWGYEDDIAKTIYSLKTYNNTFGHIWHPSSDVCNNHTRINQAALNMYQRGQISSLDDGFKQMTFNITKDETYDNIREIHIDKFGVTEDFKYKNILNMHFQ